MQAFILGAPMSHVVSEYHIGNRSSRNALSSQTVPFHKAGWMTPRCLFLVLAFGYPVCGLGCQLAWIEKCLGVETSK